MRDFFLATILSLLSVALAASATKSQAVTMRQLSSGQLCGDSLQDFDDFNCGGSNYAYDDQCTVIDDVSPFCFVAVVTF